MKVINQYFKSDSIEDFNFDKENIFYSEKFIKVTSVKLLDKESKKSLEFTFEKYKHEQLLSDEDTDEKFEKFMRIVNINLKNDKSSFDSVKSIFAKLMSNSLMIIPYSLIPVNGSEAECFIKINMPKDDQKLITASFLEKKLEENILFTCNTELIDAKEHESFIDIQFEIKNGNQIKLVLDYIEILIDENINNFEVVGKQWEKFTFDENRSADYSKTCSFKLLTKFQGEFNINELFMFQAKEKNKSNILIFKNVPYQFNIYL